MPIRDPVAFTVNENGKPIKMASYACLPSNKEDIKAVLLYIHGMSDYCENYGHFFEGFADQGIAVVCMDQRGMGNSEGLDCSTVDFNIPDNI